MTLLISTDEAGYGPNLGPLLICATAWRLEPNFDTAEEPLLNCLNFLKSVKIGDSKRIFSQNGTLANLEKAVYGFLSLLDKPCTRTWRNIWQVLADHQPQIDNLPWYQTYDQSLPIDASLETINEIAEKFRSAFKASPIQLLDVNATAIEPNEFNSGCKQLGNKATLLSATTMNLISKAIEKWQQSPEPILVMCDKHGGRSKYLPMLQYVVQSPLIKVLNEGREQSIYQTELDQSPIEFQFLAKGERFPTIAVSSMFAKYLREIAMNAFNHYWQQQIPTIKRTAGYPVDAKRFFSEIEPHLTTLNIPQEILWREK